MRSIYEPVDGYIGLQRPISDSHQLRELTTNAGIQSQIEVYVESNKLHFYKWILLLVRYELV